MNSFFSFFFFWQKHSGFKPQVCSVCQERFAEMTSLQQHMRRHTQESGYRACTKTHCAYRLSRAICLRLPGMWKGVFDTRWSPDSQEGPFW